MAEVHLQTINDRMSPQIAATGRWHSPVTVPYRYLEKGPFCHAVSHGLSEGRVTLLTGPATQLTCSLRFTKAFAIGPTRCSIVTQSWSQGHSFGVTTLLIGFCARYSWNLGPQDKTIKATRVKFKNPRTRHMLGNTQKSPPKSTQDIMSTMRPEQ